MEPPTQTPQTPLQKRESSLFTVSLLVFVIGSSFSYIMVALAGVNLPRYYPVLRQVSIETIEGQISMGLYGRAGIALLAGLLITGLFLLTSRLLKALGLTSVSHTNKIMMTVVWFSVAVIVVEEWHKWGLEKRDLTTEGFADTELGLFILSIVIFFVGILLTALGIWRVRQLNAKHTNDQ